mmetsp:Transcript_37795/g.84443  ORF Transcript_37795/g.84443 Transcript_37795/m.84443 type:complete len:202 (+) Transcript_37795:1123-1728(+)
MHGMNAVTGTNDGPKYRVHCPLGGIAHHRHQRSKPAALAPKVGLELLQVGWDRSPTARHVDALTRRVCRRGKETHARVEDVANPDGAACLHVTCVTAAHIVVGNHCHPPGHGLAVKSVDAEFGSLLGGEADSNFAPPVTRRRGRRVPDESKLGTLGSVLPLNVRKYPFLWRLFVLSLPGSIEVWIPLETFRVESVAQDERA